MQFGFDGRLRTAHDRAAHLGGDRLQTLDGARKCFQGRGFACRDADFTGKLILFEHFAFSTIAKLNNRLRTFIKPLALRRKAQLAIRANEERMTELCFQVHELARQRRLRDAEPLGRARNAFRCDSGDEIAKNTDFHESLPKHAL